MLLCLPPCVSTKQPPAPVDFPCQIPIAVGCQVPKAEDNLEEKMEHAKQNILSSMNKNRPKDKEKQTKGDNIELSPLKVTSKVKFQSCGSALDFVCHHQYGGIIINNPWEASYYTTAIAALILIKAYALGQ